MSTQRLVELDKQVDTAEDNGIRARWEFGRELLGERIGKLLPRGRLEEVCQAIQKSHDEVERRMKFAEWFPTEKELTHAVRKYGSWHRIVDEGLRPERPAPATPSPLPTGKFRVVYADPPWTFANSGFDQSSAAIYPTMSLEQICTLPVLTLIGDAAVLFLWVPSALLAEGLIVAQTWGFDYKTNRVWIKDRAPGMGWYVDSRHELLFVATRGEGMMPKVKPPSWFEAPVRAHSQKPDVVYQDIEAMYDGPYVELFARESRKGWTSWGDELEQETRGAQGIHGGVRQVVGPRSLPRTAS